MYPPKKDEFVDSSEEEDPSEMTLEGATMSRIKFQEAYELDEYIYLLKDASRLAKKYDQMQQRKDIRELVAEPPNCVWNEITLSLDEHGYNAWDSTGYLDTKRLLNERKI